ncbi:cdkn1a interacting zinc finger protein 1a [Genypterus blacodes]|uniref:cdkn1a interacting zinc finger protein 1a n=1 Tax=Genypterus blacodes TaxID=154954 RepID=UPI003F7702E5
MFNPHIHQQQQQQQQQQFHQHLRQLQQLFQQQPPPPPPQPPPGHHVAHHHHQAPRAIAVPPQAAPPPRMVNMCQANQTTLMAPNPMLQGAILMQQMQAGNMRNFAMGGQQFRQFFAAGARSSLLGPVPMGVAIKSPMVGFPAVRAYHPHARYYNSTATPTTSASSSSTSNSSASFSTSNTTDAVARQPDRKRDSGQIAAESADGLPAASSTSDAGDKNETDGAMEGADASQTSEEQLEEPVVKKQRTERSEEPREPSVVENVAMAEAGGDVLSSECNSNAEDSHHDGCHMVEEGGSTMGSAVMEVHSDSSALSPPGRLSEESLQGHIPQAEEAPQDKDDPLASLDNQEEDEEGVVEGANKFYCYLCSITCHNQQNFRSHMNSVSHQQRMMEIQHMSNACLVSLLPRVQESLQAAHKDGEKRADVKHWCATCQSHFTCSIKDHRRTEEHKFARRMAISSCTVCKKHFRTSQVFVEHLQSQEHRQAVETLQDREGDEALAKLSDADTEGCSVEEVEGSEVDEEEEGQGSDGDQESCDKQEGWSSLTEVSLKDMTSDEEHDANKVYGSSFLTPVAGFLCRLCDKFYHFESAALHSHCKSLKHFENLKRYSGLLGQKDEAAQTLLDEKLQSVTETATDCSDGNGDPDVSGLNSLSDDTALVSSFSSTQPVVAVTRLRMQTDDQQEEEHAEPSLTPLDLTSTSAPSSEPTERHVNLPSGEEEVQEEVQDGEKEKKEEETTAQVVQEPDSAAALVEEEEKEAQPLPGKKRAKPAAKRRSGRASRR